MKKGDVTDKYDALEFQIGEKVLTSPLRLKSEFDLIKSDGNKFVSNNFVMLYTCGDTEGVKLGIICGRKYDTRAVTRNRVRRIFKEAFRQLRPCIKDGVSIIFIPKKNAICLKMQDIKESMSKSFKKASLAVNG